MRLNLALLFASVATLAACSHETITETASNEADVTDVQLSPNVQQTISNCWDMATSAWIESLSRRPQGAEGVDISEAYVSYMYWYVQLVHPNFPGTLNELGNYGFAAEILARYGWMTEQEFLGQSEPSAMATRHAAALNAVRWELVGGELKRPDQRANNPANVIKVLNRAWGVSPEIAAELEKTFGADYYTHNLRDASVSTEGTHLRRLSEIKVGVGDDGQPITALDVVGDTAEGQWVFSNERRGRYAFSGVDVPQDDTQLRAYFTRVERGLLQDLPLPIALWYDQAKLDATGTFQAPVDGTLNQPGAHMMMLFDMTVDAPGFGVLPAGIPELRPEARAAALREDATVLSLRAKNSAWGNYVTPGPTVPFAGGTPGVHDFSLSYLTMRAPGYTSGRALWFIVMPNDANAKFLK